ncbi:hypothetical protein CERSUDRAFT_59253 [Gelatoporia subvermispora B]|uniref:Protein kinase domain-containing protein n=1 Tax=Ceriporiopsis subvermispora (strain B) TaxID=914234 RepID=M2P985_CERS8|nr:hypothetical protein CERSUDRAFT_59253 [Gelatoporia subvermispora B]
MQGLCHTDPTNKTRHQRGLKLLRHLCAKNQIYPQAVVLRLQSLQQVGDTAEAFGGSSRVFRGKLDEKDVALKVVVSSREFGCDPRIVKRVLREAMIWRHLRHRNIATFHGVDVSLYPLCLVSEWVPLGTVSQYLFKNPRSNRTKLVRDIADGLAYLHALEIVHADLKAANVLVNKEHVASLIDFGIATLITDLGTSFTPTTPMTGTIRWAAPEVLDPEQFGLPDISRFTKASDIYSLSMTMWEVFTGHVPFHNFQNDGQVIRKITRGVRPARPPHSVTSTVGLTDSMWTLMESCWSEDCSRRPEITDVLSVVQGEDLSTDQGPLSWPLELDEYQVRLPVLFPERDCLEPLIL